MVASDMHRLKTSLTAISGLLVGMFVLIIAACSSESTDTVKTTEKEPQQNTESISKAVVLDIQGHRGARGIYPENTIEGFKYAMEQGVTTLEMDIVVTRDSQLVVSHEPWMSHHICKMPDGTDIEEQDATGYNIYLMTYDEVKRFDCGSRGNKRFPQQQKIATNKPLLKEVIDMVETIRKNASTDEKQVAYLRYNIETKSREEGDNLYHPVPEKFARLLHDAIAEKGIQQWTTIQSFDVRTLQEMRKIDSTLSLALLIENPLSLEENLEKLGFRPHIYSPYYKLVDKSLVENAHQAGMKVIPWTINTTEEIEELIELGVDGFITDYPKMGMEVATRFGP